MVRYEIRKVLGTFGGKIALLLYLAVLVISCCQAVGYMNWNDAEGKSYTGFAAVKPLKEARREWEGPVDEETLKAVLAENQRINAAYPNSYLNAQQGNIAYGLRSGFLPIRNLLNWSFAEGFRSFNYFTVDTLGPGQMGNFYANRVTLLKDWLYDESDAGYTKYTEEEKQYLIRQYEALETPLTFDYYVGWESLFENGSMLLMLGIFILSYLLAGIFSNEFRWKADSVYYSTRYGRDLATAAKIKAGFLLVTVLYWGSTLIYTLVTLCCLGFDGGSCAIQWLYWKSMYNLNLWQTWALTLLCAYIGNLFLGFLTMYLSAKTKSSLFAVTVPFILYLIPAYLMGEYDWDTKLFSLLPTKTMSFPANLTTFDLFTIFGKVFRASDLALPLYLLLSLILVPVMYREFRKKAIC